MKRFNEGKAIDAVLRRIEKREKSSRADIRFPEKEGQSAPIEFACRIGATLFAFEHTGIEPFERHIELNAKSTSHFKPIQDLVEQGLPKEASFELLVAFGATLDMQLADIQKVQKLLVAEILRVAPSLSDVKPGRVGDNVELSGLPFRASIRRIFHSPALGALRIKHFLERPIEETRIERIGRGYKQKANKLAKWKNNGASTILVLEENDIQNTNCDLISEAVEAIENDFTGFLPDEVHLVSSVVPSAWSLYVLRVNEKRYVDLSVWGKSLIEDIDPTSLTDLTGR